jgi:hypothetical protein
MTSPPDRYLDLPGSAPKPAELGIVGKKGLPVPPATVRTWADKGRLPFFQGPDGKRRISERALAASLRKMQRAAVIEAARAENTRSPARRPTPSWPP